MTRRRRGITVSGVRERPFIRGCCGALLLALGVLFPPGSRAEDAKSDWFQQDNSWRSRTLPLGDLFQIRLDGRSFIAKKNDGPNPVPPPKDDKATPGPKITFIFDGKPVSVKREMLLDASRQAVRILDVFANSGDTERKIRVDYSTSLGDRGGVRYNGVLMPDGSAREYGQGVPDDASGAIVLAERDGSDAVPMFLWGQPNAKWHGRMRDIGSSLNISYEGMLPPGGKVALLHWVATAGLERGVRLEQGFDKFFKNGHLVQPMVPADIVPAVANFQPDAFQAESAPAVEVATTSAHRLILLEDLCERLKVKRGSEDVLFLGPDQQLAGNAAIEKLSITSRGKTVEPALSEVAAILGGGGMGRLHRLYLRSGEVLAGQITLSGGSLETPNGHISLAADAVDLLLLRTQPQDGQWPPGVAGYVQTPQGELFWLSQAPAPLKLATSFGGITVPVWQVERRREPAVSLTVLLDDGSRIQGAASENTVPFMLLGRGALNLAVGEISRWGNSEAVEKVAPDGEPTKLLADHHCTLRDGSVIAGTLSDETLRLSTPAGETAVKVGELVRLDCKTPDDTSVELAGGTKLKGVLLNDVLHWKRSEQAIAIPTSLVTELVKKHGAAPATTSNAPVSSPPKA